MEGCISAMYKAFLQDIDIHRYSIDILSRASLHRTVVLYTSHLLRDLSRELYVSLSIHRVLSVVRMVDQTHHFASQHGIAVKLPNHPYPSIVSLDLAFLTDFHSMPIAPNADKHAMIKETLNAATRASL